MGNALGEVEGGALGEVEGGALGEGESSIEGERVPRRLHPRVCDRPRSTTRRTCSPPAPTPLMPGRSRPVAPVPPPAPGRSHPAAIDPVATRVEQITRVSLIPWDLDPTKS